MLIALNWLLLTVVEISGPRCNGKPLVERRLLRHHVSIQLASALQHLQNTPFHIDKQSYTKEGQRVCLHSLDFFGERLSVHMQAYIFQLCVSWRSEPVKHAASPMLLDCGIQDGDFCETQMLP